MRNAEAEWDSFLAPHLKLEGDKQPELRPLKDHIHERWIRLPIVNYIADRDGYSHIIPCLYPALMPPEELPYLLKMGKHWFNNEESGFELRVSEPKLEWLWYPPYWQYEMTYWAFMRSRSTMRGYPESFEYDYIYPRLCCLDPAKALRFMLSHDDPPCQLEKSNSPDPLMLDVSERFWSLVRDYDLRLNYAKPKPLSYPDEDDPTKNYKVYPEV